MKVKSNKKENMVNKGIRLKECRKERHLTQENIAKFLNCSNNHISMIERGERDLNCENARLLSKYFGVPVDYLLCIDSYENDETDMGVKAIKYQLRPCYIWVGDIRKRALFHCWSFNSKVIEPSPMIGGHKGGIIAYTTALVELEDGTVLNVFPENLVFDDHILEEYYGKRERE